MFSFAAHNLFATSSSICEASVELFGIPGFLRQLRDDSLILPGMKSGDSQRQCVSNERGSTPATDWY
jgi:hypothetical protein